MKLLAYGKPTYDSEIVTIDEAIRIRKRYPLSAPKEYYDLIRLRPMTPTERSGYKTDGTPKQSSFSFSGGAGGAHDRGSKGIAHELAQEALCHRDSELFTFTTVGRLFELKVAGSEEEVAYENPFRRGTYLYADVVLYLADDSPHRETLGNEIAIELCDTNPVHGRKKAAYRALRLTCLEFNLMPDWHVPNQAMVSPEELARLRARIRGYWRSHKLCATLVSCPTYLRR